MTYSQAKECVRTGAVSLSAAAFLTIGVGASTGIAQQTRADSAPAVTLPNTHEHVLHSRVNGRTYVIQVSLPDAYVDRPGDKARYPTLYLLDMGTWPLLHVNLRFSNFLHVAQPILVGVEAVEPKDRPWPDREADYGFPITAADSQYFKRTGLRPPLLGGAPQFLRVLKEEIIPLIDSSYRTSGDRGIEGVSMAGLFVAYAMLEEPELFTRYVMISPSLWYPWGREKGEILTREPAFAKQHPTFKKTIYINVGANEDPGMIAVGLQFFTQLCKSMADGYYKGLDLAAEIIPGETHGSLAARVRSLSALYPADSTRPKVARGWMEDCH
jgi:predicted alpha/beta superfamily hydrolase